MRLDTVQLMTRDFGEPVTLPGGMIVPGRPGVATTQDELGGEAVIAGRTRTLDLATADCPGLQDGQIVTWQGGQYSVRVTYLHGGQMTRLFLGRPR